MQKLGGCFGVLLALGACSPCFSQVHSVTPQGSLSVDAGTPAPAVRPADYVGGANRSPDGRVLGVTDRYLTLAGKPWIPVMGEMHYARVPEADWDADLARMKAAGVDVVSTYVIWIHHEEVQGQWDWSGRRDLRRFAQLCQRHGMLLMVRIGPWSHAETRNGGFPDWVVKASPTRQLNPTFMAETRAFDNQIGMQLHGLLWKDGGPVIGVQIENEYARRGPGEGAPYLLALKSMARQAGLDVPLYTVTGWDNAVVPAREFLPVYGGYPTAPWGGSTKKLPPQEVYAFRFGSRVSGSMGMIGASAAAPAQTADDSAKTPFLTAEIGGGNEDTYHRRPVISADDIAAMAPVMLGSGVNGYGTYMMVGGENPQGKLTTLEESQATGYPTDVPVKSYDFQAPIGEFGRERRSLRLLKEWNYFMQDFGPQLAPMPVYAPKVRPRSTADLSVLRWSVRTDGSAGFVFVNNYVRGAEMPPHKGVQFTITLPGGRVARFPERPVDIPSGAFFAWPFGLQLGAGVELRYATAQLMATLPADADSGAGDVLFCQSDIRCELSLSGHALHVQAPPGLQVERSAEGVLLTRGPDAPAVAIITLQSPLSTGIAKAPMRLILLSAAAAENTWKLPFAGAERLVQTSADLWADEGEIHLGQLGNPVFHFTVYPPVSALTSAGASFVAERDGQFRAALPPANITASLEKERSAGTVPPDHMGPPLPWRPIGVAQAPDDAEWAKDAAVWRVRLTPEQMPPGISNIFLRLDYVGDEARLVGADGILLDDNFWNGEPWMVGLRRFAASTGALPKDLHLQLLPLHADPPIYLPSNARAMLTPNGQTLHLKQIEAVPEYSLQVHGTQ